MSVKGLVDISVRPLSSDRSVADACQIMHDKRVGAVAVTEGGSLCGIFTHRDVVERVVLAGRDPNETRLSEVMSRNVETMTGDASYGVALRQMVEKDYTYMPVVTEAGDVRGMISMRGLLDRSAS